MNRIRKERQAPAPSGVKESDDQNPKEINQWKKVIKWRDREVKSIFSIFPQQYNVDETSKLIKANWSVIDQLPRETETSIQSFWIFL